MTMTPPAQREVILAEHATPYALPYFHVAHDNGLLYQRRMSDPGAGFNRTSATDTCGRTRFPYALDEHTYADRSKVAAHRAVKRNMDRDTSLAIHEAMKAVDRVAPMMFHMAIKACWKILNDTGVWPNVLVAPVGMFWGSWDDGERWLRGWLYDLGIARGVLVAPEHASGWSDRLCLLAYVRQTADAPIEGLGHTMVRAPEPELSERSAPPDDRVVYYATHAWDTLITDPECGYWLY